MALRRARLPTPHPLSAPGPRSRGHRGPGVREQASRRASLPPRGGSWAPKGSLLSGGSAERRSGRAGGWFGLARIPPPAGTGCSHPYEEKQPCHSPPPPGPLKEVAGRYLRVDGRRKSVTHRQGGFQQTRGSWCPFLHAYEASLTSILASAPLVPGTASPIPRFSFSDTVQGKGIEGQTWSMIHLITTY